MFRCLRGSGVCATSSCRANPLDLDQVEALSERGMEVTFFLPGIFFQDAQLEQAVRSAVRMPTEELTALELRAITRLRLNSSVKSLEGIEHLTNLESLSFSGSIREGELESLLPLADLSRLNILQLTTAKIEDISALSRLTSLEKLNLNNNAIVDISPLVGLVNLRELWLEINQIQDLSPLANLRRLEILYLADNAVEDLSPLAGLDQLVKLRLSDNRVTDIAPLAELYALETARICQ